MSTCRDPLYRRHRFPPEVISYAVWLYFRFPLSLRMVEEMLAARGVCVTYKISMRPVGGRSSARRSPIRSASARLLEATNGIWMRSSSRLLASRTGCARRSIKMASFSTSWSSVEETVSAAQQLIEKALESRSQTAARYMITDKLRSYGAPRGRSGGSPPSNIASTRAGTIARKTLTSRQGDANGS